MGEVREFFRDGPELKEMLELLRQYESEEHKYILNEVRWKQVRNAFKAICDFFEQNEFDASIKFKIESIKTVASIWIETDYVAIMDIPAFIDIIKVANNMSIYPKIDEKMIITLTFLDIATEVVLTPRKPKRK